MISTLQITQHKVFSVYFHLSLVGNSTPQWLFFCNVFTSRFLVTNLSNGDYSASVTHCLTLHRWTLNCTALNQQNTVGRVIKPRADIQKTPSTSLLLLCDVTSHAKPRALRSNGCYLQSHFLATGLYDTICTIFSLHREDRRTRFLQNSGAYLSGNSSSDPCKPTLIFTVVPTSSLFNFSSISTYKDIPLIKKRTHPVD
jgi:hypothetical protein